MRHQISEQSENKLLLKGSKLVKTTDPRRMSWVLGPDADLGDILGDMSDLNVPGAQHLQQVIEGVIPFLVERPPKNLKSKRKPQGGAHGHVMNPDIAASSGNKAIDESNVDSGMIRMGAEINDIRGTLPVVHITASSVTATSTTVPHATM